MRPDAGQKNWKEVTVLLHSQFPGESSQGGTGVTHEAEGEGNCGQVPSSRSPGEGMGLVGGWLCLKAALLEITFTVTIRAHGLGRPKIHRCFWVSRD